METKLTPWKVSIDNPDATHDDYVEWFSVSNGTEIYECYSRESANILCNMLNEHSQLLQQRDELIRLLKRCKPFLIAHHCETPSSESELIINEIQKHQI